VEKVGLFDPGPTDFLTCGSRWLVVGQYFDYLLATFSVLKKIAIIASIQREWPGLKLRVAFKTK
jgi:hypothetical protein